MFGAHKVHSVRILETLQTLGFKNSFEYCLVLRHCLVSRYIAFGRGSRLSSSKAASEQGNKRTGKAQKKLIFRRNQCSKYNEYLQGAPTGFDTGNGSIIHIVYAIL